MKAGNTEEEKAPGTRMLRLTLQRMSFCLLILTGAPALAENRLLPGIQGNDDRRMLEPHIWPWSAVGRVNRTVGGYCTGTLIGDKAVLTAAHCLYNPRTRRFLPPDSLHFVAAYQRGEFLAHSMAESFQASPDYCKGCPPEIARMGNDWAVIKLAKAVSIAPIMPADEVPARGDRLVQVGYSQDRPHLPTQHDGCQVLGIVRDAGLLLHDCDATRGDSGSPLLVQTDMGWNLAGIHVGTAAKADGTIYGVAVSAANISTANRLDQ